MLGELVKLRFIFIGLTHTHPNLHHVGSFKIYIIFAINLDGIQGHFQRLPVCLISPNCQY